VGVACGGTRASIQRHDKKTSFIGVISGGIPPSYGFILCILWIALPESQDRARRPTARADPSSTRTRQHITVSVIVPAHEIALDGVLTEHHRHRVVDVRGRDVAMRVHVFQSLNESLFGSIHHFHPKMIPSADLRKGLARLGIERVNEFAYALGVRVENVNNISPSRSRPFQPFPDLYLPSAPTRHRT
jgi:hypothetical protein